MKKIEKRAAMCLILAAILLLGTGLFAWRFATKGSAWASFPANQHLFTDGVLTRGRILDRDGVVLSSVERGKRIYHDNKAIRQATLHSVGDAAGQISTGAQTRFASKLSGWNLISGAYTMNGQGRDLYLTLDAKTCRTAYEALAGRKGTVGVYNYKTGEIICLVSSPTFDPANAPTIKADDSRYDGAYINRLLSATFTPGSIFKLVTTTAALEQLDDLSTRRFHCDGQWLVDGNAITCAKVHGDLTIGEALTVSCNVVYGQLATELGADTLAKYTRKAGLTDSVSVNGIDTAPGSFDFGGSPANLAWSGIGQGKDLINPCTMMRYMGAIANGGRAANPQIIRKTTLAGGFPTSFYLRDTSAQLIAPATAEQLATMMQDNVKNNYGTKNYPGLALYAKSGTAQVGGDGLPNAWFTGFIRNEEAPLAFIVLVENAGSGSKVAGSVANKVLQVAVDQLHK